MKGRKVQVSCLMAVTAVALGTPMVMAAYINPPGTPFVITPRGQAAAEPTDPSQVPGLTPVSATALNAVPPPPPKRFPWTGGAATRLDASLLSEFSHGFKRIVAMLLVAEPVEQLLSTTRVVDDPDLQRFVGKFVAALVWGVLGASALGTLGVDTKPLVAGIGVSGFLIGFTLKEVATNWLAGIMLVLQRPFRTGWSIKVGGHNGIVRSIDSRYVRLEAQNGEIVLLPSYVVYSSAISIVDRGDRPQNGRR